MRLPTPAQKARLSAGSSHLQLRAQVPAGHSLRVTVEETTPQGEAHRAAHTFQGPEPAPHFWKRLATRPFPGWETLLFGLALLIYAAMRLVRLADFPIYFFTDEAIQTLLARDFLCDGLRAGGEWFPAFFYNTYQYNLGVSVYLQVLPALLFENSIGLTRGVPALVSVLGGLWVGLTLKNVLRLPHAWAGVLFLSLTPAWFLHSRTAFETSLAAAFYAGFLYYYLRYRTGTPQALYAAVVCAALAFYTYNPMRMVVGVSALLFLVCDFGYHRSRGGLVLRALGLTVLLALPYVRFLLQHPGESTRHLHVLGSYWVANLGALQKLGIYLGQYLRGLNPAYWFLPDSMEIPRHVMKGYGHLHALSAPFLGLGLWQALRSWRRPEMRALLLALLAAPTGAALVALGITRILALVIPAALLSALGFIRALEWLEEKASLKKLRLPVIAFCLLAVLNAGMLLDALRNGPTWFTDYSLGGMQYGARQVFGSIRRILDERPQTHVVLSPSWSNGTDIVARFFFPLPLPFEINGSEAYMIERRPLDGNTLMIVPPNELDNLQNSGKFRDLRVEETLPCPDGSPCFYFVRLDYIDDIDGVFAREKEARRALQQGSLVLDGVPVLVRWSYLDMGPVDNAFDGNADTLIRTMEANPLVLEVDFPEPRRLQAVSLRVGATAAQAVLRAHTVQGDEVRVEQSLEEAADFRTLRLELPAGLQVSALRLELKNVNEGEPGHVHLWEVGFE